MPPALKTRRDARRQLGSLALSIACLALLGGLAAPGAWAQVGARIVAEPPSAVLQSAEPPERTGPAALAASAAPAVMPRGRGNEVFYDLTIRYTEGKIFNPATGLEDEVELRSYVGDVTSPLIPFVGPRVDIWPGETFRLSLRNDLPADDPSCPDAHPNPDMPHCFNSTNMHTHGLWVSPVGNSDNVLLSINPGIDFQFEYNIPPDHPAGTYWYHSHLHGSTGLQVSSGMAGALIIHGDRLPTAMPDGSIKTGDVDTLLQTPEGQPFKERVVLLQQISYACRDDANKIKINTDGTWRCDPGDVGSIEGYDQLGRTSWKNSGRFTSINGEVVPTFTGASAGAIERWRLIHAGVRESIKLRFRKLEPAMAEVAFNAATSEAKQAFVDQNCTGAPITQLSMASDGLTRAQIGERIDTVLQPGYREDLLMLFPESGVYCVIDESLVPEANVNGEEHGRELLGYVEVGEAAEAPTGTATGIIRDALVASAGTHMPPDVRDAIVADLQNGLRLSAFIDQPDIAPSEVTGTQGLGFRIGSAFEIGELKRDPTTNKLVIVDPAPYEPTRIDRTLLLGGVDEWTLTSFTVAHPFHIHVNPFQIVAILDPTGNDVSVSGEADDPQYANLRGVWKDTLFVKQGYEITVRTRYRRYIGEFVLHCHILDHEDLGMMQNVRIAVPDGRGGPTMSHN